MLTTFEIHICTLQILKTAIRNFVECFIHTRVFGLILDQKYGWKLWLRSAVFLALYSLDEFNFPVVTEAYQKH